MILRQEKNHDHVHHQEGEEADYPTIVLGLFRFLDADQIDNENRPDRRFFCCITGKSVKFMFATIHTNSDKRSKCKKPDKPSG
jgi:hypothetical protein